MTTGYIQPEKNTLNNIYPKNDILSAAPPETILFAAAANDELNTKLFLIYFTKITICSLIITFTKEFIITNK